ncbi:MAG: aspartate aminotransferase family protein [Thaumarchaeota archaeon]|nr:aspartate aminotransferase family protein [Nitrososphaerota archaeon]MCL5318847.1 aspartate aminotransferase family protein [Nitrososphaerota archaeon]
MNEEQIGRIEDQHLAATYSKLPLTIAKGRAASLWDAQGNEYIDCMGGYGVAIVGHCNPKVVDAIRKQSEKLITCHGSIYNEARAELLNKLIRISPPNLSRAFLCSSGAESVEAAIKIARRYTRRPEIIAMTGSYHGKTLGALSATWTQRYREPFQPLLPEVVFTTFGDAEKAREAVSDKTAAVIVEPIQGETGIKPAPDGFLKELREICDAHGSLLIFDEVQTGFGRTGRMWACQHWGVQPDIMCVSKAMAGGLPMGAALAREEVMGAMAKGDHSSTFGGNPLSCAAASAVIDYILDEHLVERAEKLGKIFKQGLSDLAKKHQSAREARGMGLMLALEMRFDVHDLLLSGLKEHVLLLYSGKNVLRFLPPLVITEKQINDVLTVLDKMISAEEKTRFEH